jgi:glutamine cyclotransferase
MRARVQEVQLQGAYKSYLRIWLQTGKVYKQIDLEDKYFGEGITFINGKLYQLTWQEKIGFIYNATTLKLEKALLTLKILKVGND